MIKNLLITYLFTVSSVMAGLPPTTIKNQNAASKTVNFNLELPNNQSVPTAASTALITTGNKDELQNSNFEHTTVTTGWTISNATASANTASPLEGKKSLSLALTGALSLSQSSTINAAQKSGVQMVASVWVNSSDVSDLRLCSLKNGAEDKCTVTGGYVQGSGWRQLTVSFLGNSTSNGLKLKSTDTTGTVLVDQAYVGIGSPVVDFAPDMVFSAAVSITGIVSGENTEFISGNCTNANPSVCTLTGFTVSPNCYGTSANSTSTNRYINVVVNSATQVSIYQNDDAAGNNRTPFTLVCEKTGADYKTSKAYVASSSDTDWQSYTPTFTGFGVPTNVNFKWKREGSDLLVEGNFTSGSSTATEARVSFPNSVATSSSVPTISISGYAALSAAVANQFLILKEPSATYMTFGIQNGSNAGLTKFNGNLLMSSGQTLSLTARIPIQGWTDSGVIVGSFEGIEKCANDYECTSEFTAYISSAGVVSNENIDWINGNCTNPAGTQRSCTYKTNLKDGVNPLSSPMNCTASAKTGTGYTSSAFVVTPTTTGFIFNSGYGTTGEYQDIIVHCQKGPNDYKPKTAKIASSIGVPTVPGITTEAVETFSVVFGTTNKDTPCTASPCSYISQIGNAVTNITRSGTGLYNLNLSKTYSKANCTIDARCASVSGGTVACIRPGSILSCENCNSVQFAGANKEITANEDIAGTIICQGIPQ